MAITIAHAGVLLVGPVMAAGLLAGCSSSGSGETASPSAPASASAGQASATPSGTPVATADLTELVSDRTFSGIYEGTTYTEYYAPDGSIRGEQDGEKYTASWELVGDTICFTYPEDGADAGPDCYTATQDGANVYWFNEDGSFSDATTWVAGNPNNL